LLTPKGFARMWVGFLCDIRGELALHGLREV
jgi:hypothetical protein